MFNNSALQVIGDTGVKSGSVFVAHDVDVGIMHFTFYGYRF